VFLILLKFLSHAYCLVNSEIFGSREASKAPRFAKYFWIFFIDFFNKTQLHFPGQSVLILLKFFSHAYCLVNSEIFGSREASKAPRFAKFLWDILHR